MMGQKPDAKLTPEIAREVCQRTGSAAVLDGSIASLGSQYVLGLEAMNCRTGDSLAQVQAAADGKEGVLKALGEAAVKLRGSWENRSVQFRNTILLLPKPPHLHSKPFKPTA
jgi:eukaryotic-like serine/threonine-protein kinase